jgi:hypothetical protein
LATSVSAGVCGRRNTRQHYETAQLPPDTPFEMSFTSNCLASASNILFTRRLQYERCTNSVTVGTHEGRHEDRSSLGAI